MSDALLPPPRRGGTSGHVRTIHAWRIAASWRKRCRLAGVPCQETPMKPLTTTAALRRRPTRKGISRPGPEVSCRTAPHLEDLRPVQPVADALAHNLGGVHEILEVRLVHLQYSSTIITTES